MPRRNIHQEPWHFGYYVKWKWKRAGKTLQMTWLLSVIIPFESLLQTGFPFFIQLEMVSREMCPTFLRPALKNFKREDTGINSASHKGNKLIPHFKIPEVEESKNGSSFNELIESHSLSGNCGSKCLNMHGVYIQSEAISDSDAVTLRLAVSKGYRASLRNTVILDQYEVIELSSLSSSIPVWLDLNTHMCCILWLKFSVIFSCNWVIEKWFVHPFYGNSYSGIITIKGFRWF